MMAESGSFRERQITDRACGHVLTNINVWSPDSRWIVYDTRSDPAGDVFDAMTIEVVNVETGEVREIFRSRNGAHCGVATFSPVSQLVAFILGPEYPTDDWQYCPWHRQGVLVNTDHPNIAIPLDARDITPPFTEGALRGGSHVHIFNESGQRVSFTYEDHVLASSALASSHAKREANQRNVGVSVLGKPVHVKRDHARNHDGIAFSVLVTQTEDDPRAGSDDLLRACEEGWIGVNGYVKQDGSRQLHALAFQGKVLTAQGREISEVFVVDLPEDLSKAGAEPITGSETTRPRPPHGVAQRRITRTDHRKSPGIQGPRHWLRSSPDGSQIAFLMRDDAGIVQIWTVSPNGGDPSQLTHHSFDIASAFSWSKDGTAIACVADNSVFLIDAITGQSRRLTPRCQQAIAPRPEACVISPDGRQIAYVRNVPTGEGTFNQVFVVDVE